MNESLMSEAQLQNTIRNSENTLDRQMLNSLAQAREDAVHAESKWLGSTRGLLSAGIVACALVIAVFVPLTNSPDANQSQSIDVADENLQLLMEDPEFFLWVSNSYGAVSR